MTQIMNFLPESAPFDTEQRAWLNGFLAGWTGVQPSLGGESSGQTASADAPAEAAEDEEEFPWHDPALPIVDRMELAADRPVERRLMAAMAQLDCGACGYECQTYSEAIARGEEKSLTLCSPGGKETSKMLKKILKEEGGANGKASPSGKAAENEASAEPSGWSRRNPYRAKVVRSINLNHPESAKQTHHVEIDLGDSGLEYAVGDSLGVIPANCEQLVDELIAELGASGEEPLDREDGAAQTLKETLRQNLCLTEITDELLELLAEHADETEADALHALIDDDSPLEGCDVLDLLRKFPSARPSARMIVAALAELKPRLYSISSCPRKNKGKVHLTVGRVSWRAGDRTRKGVASTMFADRLAPGDDVRVFVQKSHGFTAPADPAAPMIMVGPGTGIAPFRAFLQHRETSGAVGKNWLFFGDQRREYDYLYREELEAFREAGLLTRLDLAFSRDQSEKVYVQDRMLEQGAELWRWLEDGGHFYVCGDAKRMARDVDAALHAIVQEHGGRDEAGAKQYVKQLTELGRYCRDVY